MSTLSGSVERIVFQNPETSFTVARLVPADRPKRTRRTLTTVTGHLPDLHPGAVVELSGEWYDHPRHGTTFSAKGCTVTLPAEEQAIVKYLASGWVRGLGEARARSIVGRFGADTFRILSEEPHRLAEVKGIGVAQAREIAEAWREQAATREIAEFLRQHGLDVALAGLIFNVYGAQAVTFIKQNPFRLDQDFDEVRFADVERLARALGHPREGRDHLAGALRHTLASLSEDGHVFAPRGQLVETVATKLRVDRSAVDDALEHLRRTKQVIVEPAASDAPAATLESRDTATGAGARGDGAPTPPDSEAATSPTADPAARVYLTAYFLLEIGAARHLAAILDTPDQQAPTLDWDSFFSTFEAEERLTLAPEQRQAARQAVKAKACVITGGPGVGKTMALRVLVRALRRLDRDYCLAAPTGRAAKRLADVTEDTAATLHRLLGFQPWGGRFTFDGDNPLPFDYVIVDEASMLDLPLLHQLLKAIPPWAHLVLVGDTDQLPSIGPGNVLADLIGSGALPVVRLTRLFRQAKGSQLLRNAHRVNQGLPPLFAPRRDSDFFLIPAGDPQEAAATIVSLVQDRLPRSFGLDRLADIQVLSPVYAGACGVTNLNQLLQAALNPRHSRSADLVVAGQQLREGDKVMQIRNNYVKAVYNGDLGVVERIDPARRRMLVRFGPNEGPPGRGGLVLIYEPSELGELVLAYAASVHKAQGSEYPAVVMPALLEHQSLLQRSLLYTAITRAKRLCVLVGSAEALVLATSRNLVERRRTALSARLHGLVQDTPRDQPPPR